MEENEIMVNEVTTTEENTPVEVTEEKHSGIGFGTAMLIGGGIALAAAAGAKKLKKAWIAHKAKKKALEEFESAEEADETTEDTTVDSND